MTRTMKKWFQTIGLAAALAFVAAAPVGAVDINGGLTPGVVNTIEDQDREAYIDANLDGLLSVGDVFIGFVRMDDFGPSGGDPANTVYGIISNQIIAVDPLDPTIISLGTTTVAGLTLQDLTGDPNTAGGMFAIYDGIAPLNLINALPVAGADMFDYISYIATGDLRLVAGIVSPDNYLMVDNGILFPIGTPNGSFPTIPTSTTTGNFTGGLDILYNDTIFNFADAIVTVDALGGVHTTPVGIANGAVRGADGATNENNFINAPGFPQCTTTPTAPGGTICGFVTDADFFVLPLRVPEPGSLALFGIALLAGVAVRRGVKKA